MRIQEIEAFLAVCRYGTFSRAAEKTFTTQSTISQQIHSLEQEFDTQLIVRKKGQHQVALTPSGQMFLGQAEKWAALWRETKNAMCTDEREEYRFSCVTSLTDLVFPVLFEQFQQFLPNCFLSLNGSLSFQIIDEVESGELDSGLVCGIRPVKNASAIPIASEDMIFVCKKEADYPENVSIRLLDPAHYVYVNWYHESDQWHKHWFGSFAPIQVQIASVRKMDPFFTSSKTWSVIPASFAKSFDQSRFRFCRLDAPPPKRQFYLVSRYPVREPFQTVLLHALLTSFRSMDGVQILTDLS